MADDKDLATPADKAAKKSRKKTPASIDPNWRPGDDTWEPVPCRMDAVDWSYSEPEWFTPGHNEKGQSIRFTLRMPPEMERAVDVLLQTRRFPYKTQGDLIRHAVYRHLFLLHRLESEADRHILVVIDGILEQLRDDEMRQRVVEMFSLTESRIKYHQSQGNFDECVRLALSELSRLEASQPGHTRDTCIGILRRMMVPIARAARERREALAKNKQKPVTMMATNIAALPAPPEDDPED